MEKNISKAEGEDVHPLAVMLTEAMKYKVAHGDMAWGTDEWTDDEVEGLLKLDSTYVMKDGQEVIGTVTLTWEDEKTWGEMPPDAGYIQKLAVKEGHHGEGVGGQLMKWAEQEVRNSGREFLRLDCPVDPPGLCEYYQKCGFVRVGTLQKEGNEYATALFEKKL